MIKHLCLLLLAPGLLRAEVYLSKEEALERVFGKECAVHYEPQKMDEALFSRLAALGLEPEADGAAARTAHFFRCVRDGKNSGYALIDEQVGKHMPITYIVGISPAGLVTRVEVMVFREEIGWEARERAFLQQFEGKKQGDPVKLGSDIRHVSGATLSSRAITTGVRRALFLWREWYSRGDHS